MSWREWPYAIRGGFVGALIGILQVILSFFDLKCPGGDCSIFKKLFIWMGDAGYWQCSILGDACKYTVGPVILVLELLVIGAIIGWVFEKKFGNGNRH
jgi:uncharacterized membrane protein